MIKPRIKKIVKSARHSKRFYFEKLKYSDEESLVDIKRVVSQTIKSKGRNNKALIFPTGLAR
jgi:hypothetical protein